jgi:hypothetical protein
MPRDRGAHDGNGFRKFDESLEFAILLSTCVDLVIQVLPATRSVLAYDL